MVNFGLDKDFTLSVICFLAINNASRNGLKRDAGKLKIVLKKLSITHIKKSSYYCDENTDFLSKESVNTRNPH